MTCCGVDHSQPVLMEGWNLLDLSIRFWMLVSCWWFMAAVNFTDYKDYPKCTILHMHSCTPKKHMNMGSDQYVTC